MKSETNALTINSKQMFLVGDKVKRAPLRPSEVDTILPKGRIIGVVQRLWKETYPSNRGTYWMYEVKWVSAAGEYSIGCYNNTRLEVIE